MKKEFIILVVRILFLGKLEKMRLSTKLIGYIVVLALLICIGIGTAGIGIFNNTANKIARELCIGKAEMGMKHFRANATSQPSLLPHLVDNPELKNPDWNVHRKILRDYFDRLA